MHDVGRTHKDNQVNEKTNEAEGRQEMCPYVHTLVVQHEQTPEYLLRGIKVYPVAMSDMLVILHVTWGLVVVTYEMLVLVHLETRFGDFWTSRFIGHC